MRPSGPSAAAMPERAVGMGATGTQFGGLVANAQIAPVQLPVTQSPGLVHCLLAAHGPHDPPQSVSVSSMSLTVLVQWVGSSMSAPPSLEAVPKTKLTVTC